MRKKFVLLLLAFLSLNVFTEELNVLYMAQAGYQPDEIRKIADLFEVVSEAKVNITYLQYEEMHKEIIFAAGMPFGKYDVVLEDLIWTAEFAEYGIVEKMTDKIDESTLEDIPKAVLDAFRYKGDLWAFPFLTNFQMFFYNTEIMKKAGFTEPPKTLEEWLLQMKTIKEKDILEYPYSDSWNKAEGLVCEFVWLTGAFGGDLFDNDGKPIFNTDAGLKAANFMQELLKEDLVNPASLFMNEAMAKDDFIDGNSAFTTNWGFQIGEMRDRDKSKVADVSEIGLIPVSKDVNSYVTSSVSGFQGAAILKNSENKSLAMKYIKFVTSSIIQRGFLVEMPIWKSLHKSSYVRENFPDTYVKSILLANVHHRPKVANYQIVSNIIQKYLHRGLMGTMNMKDALDQAVKEINIINN